MLRTDVLGMFGGSVADPAPAISIPAGITIGLLASFVQSLGLTFQRKSHVLNQEVPEGQRKPEHRRPLWLAGFAIFFLSNVFGSVFQIASLPVVILAPLGAVSLLWNALFARFILGDLFSKFMVIGTLLIVAGAVLIARFGIVPEPTHSLDDLLRLFARDAFVIYFSLLAAAIFILLVVTHFLEWSLYKKIANEERSYSLTSSSRSSSPIPLTPSAHPASASTTEPTERTPLLASGTEPAPSISSVSIRASSTPFIRHRSTINAIAISYASASGTLSGMCLIFAKSGVELLLLTLAGDNQFWRWESWALVGGLVAFALLQLWYLHKSLILANPTLVCPLAFCFYNISSIVNGLVYYDQLDLLTPLQLGLVVLGTAVLLSGVWAVSITVEDEEVGEAGIREGDWIPADEPGVAPAVAPADVVRIAERATGTLPPPGQPVQAEPVHGQEPSSPTSEDDYVGSSPTRPIVTNRRNRSGRAKSAVPPLNTSPTLPRFSALLSPAPHDASSPVLPGFSIGISAVSPGFIGGTRRRSELGMGHPHGNPPNRRSISDTVGPSGRSPVDRMERRRQSRTVDSLVDDGPDGEILVGPDTKRSESPELMDGPDESTGGSRWIWRILPWQIGHGRRRDGKDTEAQIVAPASGD